MPTSSMSGARRDPNDHPDDVNDYAAIPGPGLLDHGDPQNPPDPTPGNLKPIPSDPPLIEREIQK